MTGHVTQPRQRCGRLAGKRLIPAALRALLAAAVVHPVEEHALADASRATLTTHTPHISQNYYGRGMYFAARGYPFRTVDVRGRGNSEGGFKTTHKTDAQDGYDVVECGTVHEILPDGGSVRLITDVMRARYRESLREARLVKQGEVLRYDFDRFTFILRLVKKGSRLRLVLGPLNSIYAQKNYNSGGVVADESMKDARPVSVTLYHDAKRPSALYVPIGAGQ